MLRQIIGQIGAQKDERRSEAFAPPPLGERTPILSATYPSQPQHQHSSPDMTNSKNVLANDVEIKGSIKFSSDLIIDGKIEGEVISDGSLTIGENALVKGEVKTRSLIIFGKVEGNITVQERCELKNNAILVGDIAAGTLAIEEGATFMGHSRVGKNAVSKPALNVGAMAMGGVAMGGDPTQQPYSSFRAALPLDVQHPTPPEN